MRREQVLRRQLDSLGLLGEAIDAMQSLSAHHLRAARAGLVAARAYRDGINALIAAAGITQPPPPVERPGLLLLAADLGLCDGYNVRLTEAALEQRLHLGATPVYCVGRRPLVAFRRAGVPVARAYSTIMSVAGLTGLLLTLADDVLGDYLGGRFSTLHVVSARFDGVGAFTPVSTVVLPVMPARVGDQAATTPYVSTQHLTRIAIREYLYSTLYELLLDALASEHGTRLVSTQSAGQWLNERVSALRREWSSVRRESSTQEVLEVASGARQRKRAYQDVREP